MARNRHPVARLILACAQGKEDAAVRLLDELTNWHGFAEFAADAVGRPVVRAMIGAMANGRAQLADGLEEVVAALRKTA